MNQVRLVNATGVPYLEASPSYVLGARGARAISGASFGSSHHFLQALACLLTAAWFCDTAKVMCAAMHL